jgi:hypothetical protein
MKLRRPSPALAISIAALVVACTGTAVAASIITSSAQIKNGIVTGSDLKNGTVQNGDIKAGTITQARLSKGVSKKLDDGSSTVVYEAIRHTGPENQPQDVVSQVATLKIPAGFYSISAKTVMSAIIPPQNLVGQLVQSDLAIGGRCKLIGPGDTDESLTNIVINQRQTPATLVMQVTGTAGAAAVVTLECSAGRPFRLSETSIIATKVGSIQLTPIAG